MTCRYMERTTVDFICESCGYEWEQDAEYVSKFEGKKEAPTMQATYNGFTGELVKLERSFIGRFETPIGLTGTANVKWLYDLSIYDSEKQVTHSFTGVKMSDIKFLGGVVSFGN